MIVINHRARAVDISGYRYYFSVKGSNINQYLLKLLYMRNTSMDFTTALRDEINGHNL